MFENSIIKLRKLSANDYITYHNWRNDLDVMQSTSPNLDIYTLEDTQGLIEMISSQTDAKGYIIVDKSTNEDVGIVSLINIDYKNRSAECIIDIGSKNSWGKGIGTSAMNLILNYAFNELNLHRIYLQVFSFNENAIKLYEKTGFIIEGRARESLYRFGKYHDIVTMGILQTEYKAKE